MADDDIVPAEPSADDEFSKYVSDDEIRDMIDKMPEGAPRPSMPDPNRLGPSGKDFVKNIQPRGPEPVLDWAQPYPDFRQAEGLSVHDMRQDLDYQRPYLGTIPSQTPENRAILQVLDMRKDYLDPFEGRGHIPEHYGYMSPLARAAGAQDIDRYYGARTGKFQMPDQSRDEYLIDIESGYAPAGSVADDRKTNRERSNETKKAEDLVKQKIDEVPDEWEGKGAPTQRDINTVRANPTDEMIAAFEEQFGEGSADEYMEPVPLPRPRPKKAK